MITNTFKNPRTLTFFTEYLNKTAKIECTPDSNKLLKLIEWASKHLIEHSRVPQITWENTEIHGFGNVLMVTRADLSNQDLTSITVATKIRLIDCDCTNTTYDPKDVTIVTSTTSPNSSPNIQAVAI